MAQIIHVGKGSGETHTNVVFLHGLGGHPLTTWQHGPDDQSFWPRWLAEDIPGLSVYSIGYETSVSRWRGTAMHLNDRATNVLARILTEPELQSGHLILIGHSLGGLVIKQLLQTAESDARNSAEAASFLERVNKVAFLATPHTGSDLAAFGNRIRIFAKPSAATTCLVRNDPNLRRLNSWYRTWANARGISHLTLTETDAIRVLGMIVKPDSGDAGLAGSNPVPIDSNHWTICKPIDRSHDTYVLVRKFIERRFERPRTATEDKLDALPDAVVARLMTALRERGETTTAEQAGVSPEAIIRLAQRINADIDDFDRALLELERAVVIAIEVVEEGRRGSNAGDFIDVVLHRIAEKSAKGWFDEAAVDADTAFAQWERDETERRDAAVAGGLKLLEAGLRQDILRRDPGSAAKRIQRMVALEHPNDRIARFAVMRNRQDEWYKSGRDKGLNFDLQVSIEAARLLLATTSGPDEAGTALIDLGLALATLGERESTTVRLKEAVEAYRAALDVRTRERVPLQWAMTQNNLGSALSQLGERDNNTARLEEAVDAFRGALQEYTRERNPFQWAGALSNLGSALQAIGERESSVLRLEEAVDAFRATLQEYTRERAPFRWARTQNNLGSALSQLGERENSTPRLEQAVDAFRAAMQECNREQFPLDWAMIQNNLGNALSMLGLRESGTARLEQAVEAYRAALQEYTRERVPLDWAMTQNNLGTALQTLGERENSTAHLEEAVEAYRAALQEYARERVPLNWAMTQNNLGSVLQALGKLESSTARLEQAIDAYRAALQEYTGERVPYLHDRTKANLAIAIEMLERPKKE
jgi:tetratricopeptide (TPR) repeat protein/pimeloyl-ACP methyl ester carboxylesterase